jgi:hypothetical protein
MGARMRRLLSFDCEGAALGASLDSAEGSTGLLLVTGGTQTRIGSHRMFERLAAALARRAGPASATTAAASATAKARIRTSGRAAPTSPPPPPPSAASSRS